MIARAPLHRHAALAAALVLTACGASTPPRSPAPVDNGPRLAVPGNGVAAADTSRPPARHEASMQGRVLDHERRPLVRARVEARHLDENRSYFALTDDSGGYLLIGLPAGSYALIASMTGFVTARYGQLASLHPGVPLILQAGEAPPDRRLFTTSAIMVPAGNPHGRPAPPLSARISPAARYEFAGVPPGAYRILARGVPESDEAPPLFATFDGAVDGRDLGDLRLALRPGARIRGGIEFSPGALLPPDPRRLWVVARPADGSAFGISRAPVQADGSFVMPGLLPGTYVFRAGDVPLPWSLEAVLLRGRDIADLPIDLEHESAIADLRLVLSVRATELTGTVRSDGRACTDCSVLLFPSDPSLWRPLSRHLHSARTDASGIDRIRGAPVGPYLAVALPGGLEIDLFEPAWLDRLVRAATAGTLADGRGLRLDLDVVGPVEMPAG